MAWEIKFLPGAVKEFQKLDKSTSARILAYLRDVAKLDDPTVRGKGLTGNLAGYWRYRIGDYRVITQIQNGELIITVIKINHRSKVYD
ncbi:type II toxin-antitoxin system RelE/ParE family toxin [Muribacter muris]|uniref:type II toxin-antitoxin system RelE family toxin n=1 Tax=Muribacter muris TaxID=67855 RepID=UPI0018847ED2|nr:type II toxin-antitoxin system RelE/ParE family toxin [Muribacter muris]MBF0785097.1 type II toxin-antitoxin system RelE/ParE family toxin [Muribacter muris]MBF0826889.1 type II toxin-antitoxin system RelE/ParE family toxin [Muribacter muris]